MVDLLLVLAGCGDPLVSAAYPGTPLATLSGTVGLDPTILRFEAEYGVAIAWAGGDVFDTPDAFIDTSFPAFYELNLYDPPPAGTPAIVELDGVLVQGAAVFLYDDVDEDGVWDSQDEPFVGASTPFVLTFQEAPWTVQVDGGGSEDSGIGYLAVRTEKDGCLESASRGEAGNFHVTVGDDKLLPDLNCDGRLNEWAALHE